MQTGQRATMSRWLVAAALSVFAISGCASDDEANTLFLSYSAAVQDSAVTHAHVTFPGYNRTFVDYGRFGPVAIPVDSRFGIIRVQFSRIKGQADTIGRGEISLQITRGNVYGADFTRVPANLSGPTCFGCSGYKNFPMIGSARASTDSMHLSYTNSKPLCDGCVAMVRDSVIVVARRE